jgi:hypothetical protein
LNTEENVLVVADKLAAPANLAARRRVRTAKFFFIVTIQTILETFVADRVPQQDQGNQAFVLHTSRLALRALPD